MNYVVYTGMETIPAPVELLWAGAVFRLTCIMLKKNEPKLFHF